MSYTALYRKYRPNDFNDVAGQEHIKRTFQNALKLDKLSHAYLFSGPRGTGKTSVAKIIAKTVNCLKAPTNNPCNECELCLGIQNNSIHDVIEIDAASNNGVDEIREIRDKVKYLPSRGRFKVYIIDEVHMLSTGAFNALLKTLEEPPKHVIFILATTEPHKIPATILSRCQRFDFRGVSETEIKERLQTIIENESIPIDAQAIQLISESVEGGMRDAVSLLDQALAYTEGEISVEDIHAIKGSVEEKDLLDLAIHLENQNMVSAFHLLDQLISKGKETRNFIDDFIRFFRDLLMSKNMPETITKSIYLTEQFKGFQSLYDNEKIFYILDLLHEAKNQMRFTTQPKIVIELLFLKWVDQKKQEPLLLMQKQNELEKTMLDLKKTIDEIKENAIQNLEKKTVKEEQNTRPFTSESTLPETDLNTKEKEWFTSKEEQNDVEKTTIQKEDIVDLQEVPNQPIIHQEITHEKPEIKTKEIHSEFQNIIDRFFHKNYETYDTQFMEDILNTGNREIKINMVQTWYDIERFASGESLKYANLITEGVLVATNGVMLIITYKTASVCNRMMKPEIYEKSSKLLSDFYKRPIKFMAIPEDLWETVSQEFIKKFKQKSNEEEWINITPIHHPKLVSIPKTEDSFKDTVSDAEKEAVSLFGDIVKMK